jgi:hypothetical protein
VSAEKVCKFPYDLTDKRLFWATRVNELFSKRVPSITFKGSRRLLKHTSSPLAQLFISVAYDR